MDFRFNTYLDDVVVAIQGHLPELASCETHPGRFDQSELARFAAKPPAVRVALLGLGNVRPLASGVQAVSVSAAAFVATVNRPGLSRDRGALNLVEALTILMADFIPACSGEGATELRAQNLYAGGDKGSAIWALSWSQVIPIGTDLFASDETPVVIPKALYLGMDPLTGPDHLDHYTRVEALPQ